MQSIAFFVCHSFCCKTTVFFSLIFFIFVFINFHINTLLYHLLQFKKIHFLFIFQKYTKYLQVASYIATRAHTHKKREKKYPIEQSNEFSPKGKSIKWNIIRLKLQFVANRLADDKKKVKQKAPCLYLKEPKKLDQFQT